VSNGLKGENALLRGHVFYCCRLVHGPLSNKKSPQIENHTFILFSQRRKRTPSRSRFLLLQARIWGFFHKRALKLRIIFVSCFFKGENALSRGHVPLQQTSIWGSFAGWGSFRQKSPQFENHACVLLSQRRKRTASRSRATAAARAALLAEVTCVCVSVCACVCVTPRGLAVFWSWSGENVFSLRTQLNSPPNDRRFVPVCVCVCE